MGAERSLSKLLSMSQTLLGQGGCMAGLEVRIDERESIGSGTGGVYGMRCVCIALHAYLPQLGIVLVHTRSGKG